MATLKVKVVVQRTPQGWMRVIDGRHAPDQPQYAVGRIVEDGEFQEFNASDDYILGIISDRQAAQPQSEIDPYTVSSKIKSKIAEARNSGDEETAKKLESYLQPKPVKLLGANVTVPNLPVELAAFSEGGFDMENFSDRSSGRRSTGQSTFRLNDGLNYLCKTSRTESVFITMEADSLVISRKVLGSTQSAKLKITKYLKIEQAYEYMMTPPMTVDEVILGQAEARSKRLSDKKTKPFGTIDLGLDNLTSLAPSSADSEDNPLSDGITNQGRVHSANPAPIEYEGLRFRSNPEKLLFIALRDIGLLVMPLPAVISNQPRFKRIEPDFIIIHQGIMFVVEVDGERYHPESPGQAQDRLSHLINEGVRIIRVSADECKSLDSAKETAQKILSKIKQTLKS